MARSVDIDKADMILVSTGLNGANPGQPGYYDQPSTYVDANGDQKMPDEIGMGVYDLVATAARVGVHVHASVGQSAAGYRYDRNCATEWHHAAEKLCYDLSGNSTLGGTVVIDTCAASREKLLTRSDLGHKDSWHFVLEKDTCEKVLFHELDKLKYLSFMFADERQQEGWINLLRSGCGANSWPESLRLPAYISQITPPCIPFRKVFLEGHTLGTDAHAAPIYRSSDSATPTIVDVPSEPVAVEVVDILQPKSAPPPRPRAQRVEPSSPTELPVPTEVIETPPTSPVDGENIADDQKLGVHQPRLAERSAAPRQPAQARR